MSVPQSNLTAAQYGYDIVVSTTNASINAGLLEYLTSSNQPLTYICCAADRNGEPGKIYSLADWLAKICKINPFDVPPSSNDAYANNANIQALTNASFLCGFALQMGLPPDILPKDLPVPICNLTGDAASIGFNLYFSQFKVVQNSPPTGWGGGGEWNVWEQDASAPWYTATTANLTSEALDAELDTTYFNNYPKQKQAILSKLNNISGTAFSLQQLLIDLDNAVPQGASAVIQSIIPPTSNAMAMLLQQLIPIWNAQCKAQGKPPVAINAIKQPADASQLQLNTLEKECSLIVDGDGEPIAYDQERQQQQSAITLNYLGTTGKNLVRPVTSFNWNWVDPSQINDKSGVLAINRNTFAQFLMSELQPLLTPACMTPYASVKVPDEVLWDVQFVGKVSKGTTAPTGTVPASGSTIITFSHSASNPSSDSYGALSASLTVSVNYNCEVSVTGNILTITQELQIPVSCKKDASSASCTAYDTIITDHYLITVDQNGNMVIQYSSSDPPTDHSSDPDDNPVIDFFAQLNPVLKAIKTTVALQAQLSLSTIQFNTAQSFIFPGAKVFTYANVGFSDYQDLIADITYVT